MAAWELTAIVTATLNASFYHEPSKNESKITFVVKQKHEMKIQTAQGSVDHK